MLSKFFISAIPRFNAAQELLGFFSHQHYIEVSAVQGSVVRGPSVLLTLVFLTKCALSLLDNANN